MPEQHFSSSMPRRDLLKTAGVGAAAASIGLGLPGVAAATAPRANNVNLYCTSQADNFDDEGNCTLMVNCGNFGPDDATGPVSLKFITPFFINIQSLPVSGGKAEWLYQNEDPFVPSIIKVTFDGIKAHSTYCVPISLKLAGNSPSVPAAERVIFTTDGENTANMDTDLTRNFHFVGYLRKNLNKPAAGNSNLYYTHAAEPLFPGGAPKQTTFNFYNGSPRASRGPGAVSLFTFATPFYCRIPEAGRPAGLTKLYENDDPAIPSVYQLEVPAALGEDPGKPLAIEIPFQVQEGAPKMSLCASGMIVPTGANTQGDLSTSHHLFSVNSVADGAV